jgi:streptogramin lyase
MRVSLFLAALVYLPTVSAAPAPKDVGQGFSDHGVATPSSCHRGAVATADGQGQPVFLAWLMDHRGCYALLLIDVTAGKAEEHPVTFPLGDSPFASILSSRGKFYSHFGSHFVEFDPAKRAFALCRKTVLQMAMSMTEDQNGVIWSATYPQSGLASYDPQSRQFTDYGHLYKQNWAEYPRSVAADDAGWVYLAVGSTACQIIAFDSRTRKAVPLVPESERTHGYPTVFPGTDGKVYGQPHTGQADNWVVLHQGQAKPIGKRPKVSARKLIEGSQGLFHTVFPDGRRVRSFDLLDGKLVVEDPKTRSQKTIGFECQSQGAHVMGVAAAPNGTICGGTAFPMRFFSYDPRRDEWVRHQAFGQWNTIGRQGDHFFVGAYSGGHLLEWDPAKPWIDTVEGRKNCNPRVLTRCSPTIIRPARLLPHPDGRTIIVGGTPAYGMTGGGLLFWERTTGERVLLTHEQVLPEQATMSLVALPGGKLLGGTTTSPGTGGERKAKQAELYLMDQATKKIEWHEPVFPGVQGYTDLCEGPDGLVWGFADRTLFFVFDPASRKVVHKQSIAGEYGGTVSHQGPRVFVRGPNQEVFALFTRAIARIEPPKGRIKLVAKSPVALGAGGDYLDGRIWFASGSHLYSYRLP